jgi:hypothetical protein
LWRFRFAVISISDPISQPPEKLTTYTLGFDHWQTVLMFTNRHCMGLGRNRGAILAMELPCRAVPFRAVLCCAVKNELSVMNCNRWQTDQTDFELSRSSHMLLLIMIGEQKLTQYCSFCSTYFMHDSVVTMDLLLDSTSYSISQLIRREGGTSPCRSSSSDDFSSMKKFQRDFCWNVMVPYQVSWQIWCIPNGVPSWR